ncbi:beta-glucosidase [Konateibacter massiliensis]|uniref:beta-glucosidase n=1 Tax=Konateibacter massiliensis TaxID=2002841 RepID=UPI000C14F116|nr:glycoside hydrolase family 3 C-terminal domain-containing protein [Konateibacter massiliensis]
MDYREKAKELVQQMTLEEKIGMIHGEQLFQTAGVPRLEIPPLKMSDGPMGVRHEFEPAQWKTIGYSDDYVTYLPCNSALAATWNRRLAYEMGEVLGEEARGRGKDVILAPGINIKRSPLCGRNFEYFSEDPYLTKELAAPFVEGVQSCDVAACVKHFALNNQETNRLIVDVEIEEKALRDIYLPAFYDTLIKAKSHSVMGAYNKIRGEHCCQSKYLLEDILRKEWGYDGVVISDWGAVHDTELAANSQLDIEMSVTYDFDQYFMAEPLREKIEKGEIAEEQVDEKVINILVLMMRLHMLGGERKAGAYNTPIHRQRALETARESVVLLKNEKKRLPLKAENVRKLLVIGENAECIHSNGGGSAEIKALYEITPLMGIKTLLGGNTQVHYVKGYCRDEASKESDVNWQEDSLKGEAEKEEDSQKSASKISKGLAEKRKCLRDEAVVLAKEYEQVILIGGLNHEQDSEGNDRSDMKLPYEQDLLIQEVLKTNPDTTVVMTGGSPVEMGEWLSMAHTLVWGWYGGMEGGTALAEVLFGRVNPSGKLPETFYKKHTDCSAHALGEFPGEEKGDYKVHYKESIFVGYRYNDTFEVEPEFCFGHGLSYTEFSYGNARAERVENGVNVFCTITNEGTRKGAESAQVYVTPLHKSKDEPFQELRGFEKVELEPQEAKEVCIFAENVTGEKDIEIRIGSSSRDIRQVVKLAKW